MVLTERQESVLSFIVECQARGFTPSLREIGDELGMSSAASVQYQVRRLEKFGYLTVVGYRRIEVKAK